MRWIFLRIITRRIRPEKCEGIGSFGDKIDRNRKIKKIAKEPTKISGSTAIRARRAGCENLRVCLNEKTIRIENKEKDCENR